jgi:CzcA family heavy metal efflux pump
MSIGRFALRHRAVVMLLMVMSVMGGAIAVGSLPSGIYPEVEFPRIGVVVRQGDAPPPVFQTTVTRPVEEALASVMGVERIRSRTIRGGASIDLLFAPDSDMWRALQLVDAALNDARAALPAGTLIRVERITPVAFPILTFNVSGSSIDPRDLHDFSEFTLAPAISRVHGVGRVGVLGGDLREMEIVVDPERAAAMHLRLDDIATRVRMQVPLATVGRFEQDHAMTTVIVSAQPNDAADIEALTIGTDPQGAPITLDAVADVFEGAQDRLYRTAGPSGDAVLVTVSRMEGASTPAVVDDVLAAVDALRPSLQPGVRIEPVYDQGYLVGEAIASVRDAIIVGIVLCLLVLGAFLRDVRAGIVAALAVPVTLAATFVAMRALGQTLNLMSLGGMAVSIGLVIDDAIVIVEAVARRLEDGASPEEAAREGTDELAAAVIGTTITTVIVLVPLAFLRGVVGAFFGALSITLAEAVVISLFVALFVIPPVAARVLRARPVRRRSPSGALSRIIGGAATRPWLGVLGTGAAIAFCVFAQAHVPSGFMPTCDEGAFVLDYEAPAGSALTDTDAAAGRIEQILRETPEVETFSRRTGAQLNPTAVTLLDSGDFVVRLRPPPRRHADEVIASIRARVQREVPSVHVEFVQLLQDMLNDLSGTPRPVEVKVFGEDYSELERIAGEIAPRLAGIDGVVDVYGGVKRPSPELVVHVDGAATSRLGLSATDVAREASAAMLGADAGSMRRFDRMIGIRVRAPDRVRYDPVQIAALPIAPPPLGGSPLDVVRLDSVAVIEREPVPTVLMHEALQPVVILSADHEGRDLGSIVRDVEAVVRDIQMPRGYHVELGGQSAEQRASQRSLAIVAGVGALLVLMVLVAQFGSVRPALAVLLTTPLALVGALAALWITGVPLNAASLMGCVLLVGLVVKNGILLLEVAEERAGTGIPYDEALTQAATRRFRPIAMTTLATIAGLSPLALAVGQGAELQQPLAIAVIGGLTLSAALSLLVLPSLAAGLHRSDQTRSATLQTEAG